MSPLAAGYPEGHQDCPNKEDDLRFLKEKVDAGADFIITQLFYQVDVFLDWLGRCRAIGIDVPIIPGIMPLNTYAGWKRMTTLCKTQIPADMAEALDRIKEDDQAVKDYGVQFCIDMIRTMLNAGVRGPRAGPSCLRRALAPR